MSARQTKIFVMIIILLSCFCEKNPVKPNNGTVNKNIVKLKDSHDKFYGFVAVWRNDLIFATPPVQKLQINSQFSRIPKNPQKRHKTGIYPGSRKRQKMTLFLIKYIAI